MWGNSLSRQKFINEWKMKVCMYNAQLFLDRVSMSFHLYTPEVKFVIKSMKGRNLVSQLVADCQIRNSFISVTSPPSQNSWWEKPDWQRLLWGHSCLLCGFLMPSSLGQRHKVYWKHFSHRQGNDFTFPHIAWRVSVFLDFIPFSFYIGTNTHCLAGSFIVGYLTSW